MRVLFYDDDPRRQNAFAKLYDGTCEIIYASNNKEAISALRVSKPFDIVFLDHDMDGEIYQPSTERNGWGIASYIAKMPDIIKPDQAVVHSMNEKAAPNMVKLLNNNNIKTDWFIFNCAEFREVMEKALAKYHGHDIIKDDEAIYSN